MVGRHLLKVYRIKTNTRGGRRYLYVKFIANGKGFTIVELLIVIVVVAVLAAISFVAYGGIQDRANQSKINSDLMQLEKAVVTARVNRDQLLSQITYSGSTANACVMQPSETDLASLSQNGTCWSDYNIALDRISTASGINVKGLKDPFGRPYFIDENETSSSCSKDQLGVFSRPFVSGWPSAQRLIYISNYRLDC